MTNELYRSEQAQGQHAPTACLVYINPVGSKYKMRAQKLQDQFDVSATKELLEYALKLVTASIAWGNNSIQGMSIDFALMDQVCALLQDVIDGPRRESIKQLRSPPNGPNSPNSTNGGNHIINDSRSSSQSQEGGPKPLGLVESEQSVQVSLNENDKLAIAKSNSESGNKISRTIERPLNITSSGRQRAIRPPRRIASAGVKKPANSRNEVQTANLIQTIKPVDTNQRQRHTTNRLKIHPSRITLPSKSAFPRVKYSAGPKLLTSTRGLRMNHKPLSRILPTI